MFGHVNPRITALTNSEITVASIGTLDLGQVPTNVVAISGTTTITSFGASASLLNPIYFIRFTGAMQLTYNATSMILPTSANITTAAGDTATFQYMDGGNWRCIEYLRLNGQALASPATGISGLTQLATSTPGAVTSVDFGSVAGTYNDLVLHWSGVSCATVTRKFMVKPSIAGVFGGANVYKKTVSGTTVGTANAEISFMNAGGSETQAAASTNEGVLVIENYASAVAFKQFTMLQRYDIGTGNVILWAEGYFGSTSAIDGLRMYWSSNAVETESAVNFDAGTFTLYGRG